MDPKRFDTWTRNRALRLSRRDAIKLAGVSGAATVLPRTLHHIAAQNVCTWTLRAETVGGPSAPAVYDGTLTFTLGPEGDLEGAAFTQAGGASVPVAGVASGRVVDVQIALSSNQKLVLTGALDQPAAVCEGAAAGMFSGPQPGDLGVWQVTADGNGSGSSATGQAASGSSASSLGCPPPQTKCGPNCCPGGAQCTDTGTGICACPGNTIQCGLSCVPLCPEGQDLDPDSCRCVSESGPDSNCLADQVACSTDQQCCSGFCTNGECRSCGGLMCAGSCIDPNVDSQNCGTCGTVCQNGSCSNGLCGCIVDGEPCSFFEQCCSAICPPGGFCGCVPAGVVCGTASDCCDPAAVCSIDRCAYVNGHACQDSRECLSGNCANSVCTGCIEPGGACTTSLQCCNYNGLGCVNGVCPQ